MTPLFPLFAATSSGYSSRSSLLFTNSGLLSSIEVICFSRSSSEAISSVSISLLDQWAFQTGSSIKIDGCI
jgi:hypothetical protein